MSKHCCDCFFLDVTFCEQPCKGCFGTPLKLNFREIWKGKKMTKLEKLQQTIEKAQKEIAEIEAEKNKDWRDAIIEHCSMPFSKVGEDLKIEVFEGTGTYTKGYRECFLAVISNLVLYYKIESHTFSSEWLSKVPTYQEMKQKLREVKI